MIKDKIESIKNQLVSDRRHFHQNPELSFEEYNTIDYICKRLDLLGIKYKKNIAKTGVLAEISGKAEGKCLLIRADMDALPLEEKTDKEYSSKKNGVMHACGHDAHTAILLNTCEVLNSLKDTFNGTIKFAFQPGEETSGGAEPMIAEGILENPSVDAAIALHMDSDLEVGTIRIKSGPMYASPDDFYIIVKGKGAHGAEPENAIDPIIISSKIILELQNIVPKKTDEFNEAVVTVGAIHAGTVGNIIPDTATLYGTARSLTNEMRDYLEQKIEEIVKNITFKYNADYEYKFTRLYPSLINNDEISKLIFESGVRCLGEDNCIMGGLPTLAGEDFAYFSQNVPSALFKLGCRNESKNIIYPIHNPNFDIDEDSLIKGLSVFVDFALGFLNQ